MTFLFAAEAFALLWTRAGGGWVTVFLAPGAELDFVIKLLESPNSPTDFKPLKFNKIEPGLDRNPD